MHRYDTEIQRHHIIMGTWGSSALKNVNWRPSSGLAFMFSPLVLRLLISHFKFIHKFEKKQPLKIFSRDEGFRPQYLQQIDATINTEICPHQRLCLLSECCSETLINCHCDFYCVFRRLFAVYFSSMYSRCDCQLEFLYEYMDMDMEDKLLTITKVTG